MFTSFSSRFILLIFLFNRLPKFKYNEEILGLISLEINLRENARKNAKVLNYFFLINFIFFAFILPKPLFISQAIKSLYVEKNFDLNSERFKFYI